MTTLVKDLQTAKVPSSIVVMEDGMVIAESFVQLTNANRPIVVIPFGKWISVRLVQYPNACCPISLTESGSEMSSSERHL